jgi:hypothetical protein
VFKMNMLTTQICCAPTLKGKQAQDVLKQINKQPTIAVKIGEQMIMNLFRKID